MILGFFFFIDLPGENSCPDCGKPLRPVTKDYRVFLGDGDSVTVANLSYQECTGCHQAIIPAKSAQRLDEAVRDHSEQLGPNELREIREKLQENKTRLAESLGLGSKTWLRWESGEQSISRSMGYFIRAMARFPEVYRWVADREWRKAEGGQ